MIERWRLPVAGLALAVTLAACSPAAEPTTTGSAAKPDSIAGAPWATTVLTDARSGDTFRLVDFKGSVVVVEPMAVWCVSCLAQQREAQVALDRLRGQVPLVYVSLGVDPGEQASDLAAYAEREGFDWRFAAAGPEVSRALADAFGPIVLSPPSTPLVVIDPTGRVVFADVGRHSATELEALIREASQ